MSVYVNKILKAIQWHTDTGGIRGALLSLSDCYDLDKEIRDRMHLIEKMEIALGQIAVQSDCVSEYSQLKILRQIARDALGMK